MTLNDLAIKHGTDKSSRNHDYCGIYERCFRHLKESRIVFMELGVGGYEYADRGGQSLRMWKEFFPNALIAGVDNQPKTGIADERIVVYKADATSEADMHEVFNCLPASPTVILDDASHLNAQHIASFKILWPRLASGGFYVIEDTESCYWDDATLKQDPRSFATPTTMNFAFGLCHDANRGREFNHHVNYDGIASVRFHRGTIIVEKA